RQANTLPPILLRKHDNPGVYPDAHQPDRPLTPNSAKPNMKGYQYAVVIQDVYVVVHCLVVQAALSATVAVYGTVHSGDTTET
ncbi:hypothetical protein RBA42_24115, partial [Mycobacteroides abscessus subsp. abscessus]|uniref:hypothetical protein n=1 Tax=Mycobacteroides abscessus TaxID=36809 RepID=UPI003CEA8A96